MGNEHYVIRGGVVGRERLRVLSRVMRPVTHGLLDRVNVASGMECLDVGCGGGDVTLELAQRVGPSGRARGVDIDAEKIALARQEAQEKGVTNVDFQSADISSWDATPEYDLVYARFLLTHLRDPATALARLYGVLRPGGILVVEDIQFSGHFSYPESPAFQHFIRLYSTVVRRRGGDPDIGPRLPSLVAERGFGDIQMNVEQPAGMVGEVKLLSPLTFENIADAVLTEELATRAELDAAITELYEFAHSPRTVLSIPRIFQVWARRP